MDRASGCGPSIATTSGPTTSSRTGRTTDGGSGCSTSSTSSRTSAWRSASLASSRPSTSSTCSRTCPSYAACLATSAPTTARSSSPRPSRSGSRRSGPRPPTSLQAAPGTLPEARDNQSRLLWRGMISDLAQREDELTGKTLVIIGLGRIGGRLAGLAKAFGMEVIGVRRDPAAGANGADAVHHFDRLSELLPRADFVALTCPLTPETQGIIGADALSRMKSSVVLVNCARGKCVDEPALVDALQRGEIVAAALDVTSEEPLAANSLLWQMSNVFITPHTAGETRSYEKNVVDILLDNLDRLSRGERTLRNGIVQFPTGN